MTKAKAIAMLKRMQEPEAWEPQITQAAFEALDMAIEALSQESSEDVISRQAAIDAVEITPFDDYGDYMRARELIEQLPSAQPERKKGKWIIKDDTERFIAQCNCCRYIEDSRRIKNFCPNCGADMRGEPDE